MTRVVKYKFNLLRMNRLVDVVQPGWCGNWESGVEDRVTEVGRSGWNQRVRRVTLKVP